MSADIPDDLAPTTTRDRAAEVIAWLVTQLHSPQFWGVAAVLNLYSLYAHLFVLSEGAGVLSRVETVYVTAVIEIVALGILWRELTRSQGAGSE